MTRREIVRRVIPAKHRVMVNTWFEKADYLIFRIKSLFSKGRGLIIIDRIPDGLYAVNIVGTKTVYADVIK